MIPLKNLPPAPVPIVNVESVSFIVPIVPTVAPSIVSTYIFSVVPSLVPTIYCQVSRDTFVCENLA